MLQKRMIKRRAHCYILKCKLAKHQRIQPPMIARAVIANRGLNAGMRWSSR